MGSLLLGLIAALAWGIHDIFVRLVSQRVSIFTALFTVLITGAIFQSAAMVFQGAYATVSSQAAILAALSGGFFTLASIALYRAFAVGPVRLVAPIIASYPIISVGWSAFSGNPVTGLQWLAILAIIAGVSVVAGLTGHTDEDEQLAKRRSTILWSLLAAFSFAVSFAAGQSASDIAPDLPIILLTRIFAIAVLVVVMLAIKAPFLPGLAHLPLLAAMGLLDAIALTSVLSAGSLPNPSFAPVAASMFGMVTILIAWAFLKEKMTPAQWGGVILTFVGIGYLAV